MTTANSSTYAFRIERLSNRRTDWQTIHETHTQEAAQAFVDSLADKVGGRLEVQFRIVANVAPMNTQTSGMDLIALAIAKRKAAGQSLLAYGAEGYTQATPFTCHATSLEQVAAWRGQLEARGFTVKLNA